MTCFRVMRLKAATREKRLNWRLISEVPLRKGLVLRSPPFTLNSTDREERNGDGDGKEEGVKEKSLPISEERSSEDNSSKRWQLLVNSATQLSVMELIFHSLLGRWRH